MKELTNEQLETCKLALSRLSALAATPNIEIFFRHDMVTQIELIQKQLITENQELDKKHILIVDDSQLNQKVLTAILQKSNCIVTLAANGQEAIGSVGTTKFDAILMDIQMPIMNGLQATKVIRSNPMFNNLPIIAMTAGTTLEERQACLDAGMNAYLVKPIDRKLLYETLHEQINSQTDQKRNDYLQIIPKSLPATLPGINIAEALTRLGGDEVLFRRLFEELVMQFKNTTIELKALIESNSYQKAKELTHTLKGVSANYSAYRLQKIANKIDESLKKGSMECSLLDELESSINELITSEASLPKVDVANPTLPQKAFILHFRHFLHKLSTNNLSADESLQMIKTNLLSLGVDVINIQQLVDTLQYQKAHSLLVDFYQQSKVHK